MRDGWVLKPLGEVCTLQRGFDLPKRLRKSGGFPLISSSGEIDSHTEAKVELRVLLRVEVEVSGMFFISKKTTGR